MTDFQKVSNWVKDNCNVDVELGNMTAFLGHRSGKIFIHHNYNLEKNGLIALLHEVGHALQTDEQYGPNHYKNVDDLEKPKEFKMYQFMNEVDAWNQGLWLAQELGIEIDKKRWQKQMEEALLTYYV